MVRWDEGATGVVVLPGGHRVRGRGLQAACPDDQPAPDFTVLLTGRRPAAPVWESRWVRWPDFWLPLAPSDALAALREAFERSTDERVEIACGGGTGRTGTALAVLARLAGVPPTEAVAWVREHYRPRAVETPWQRRFVRRVPL